MAVFIRRFIMGSPILCPQRHNSLSISLVSKISGSSRNIEAEEEYLVDEEGIHEEQALYDSLYPGHISTSFFQKSLLAVGSGIAVFLNPARGDMLCSLAETTGVPALRNIKRKMQNDPSGKQILEDKPILTSETLDVDYLGSLPDGTLGKEHWRFLQENGFSPDDRLPVNFIDDADLMYVMLRYRQCHDIVHTMIGMPPNMLGEVVVKWYEMIHTQLPMCTSAALLGHLRLGPKPIWLGQVIAVIFKYATVDHYITHRKKFFTGYLPWVLQAAPKAKSLMNIYYEKHWEQDLGEFRQEMNIDTAPALTRKTGRSVKAW